MDKEQREIALNGSGYYDPTAYAAFRKIRRMEKVISAKENAMPGDIWTAQRTAGGINEVLILATHQNFATILTLTDKKPEENAITIVSKTTEYTDAGKIGYVFYDYLCDYVKTIPDKDFHNALEKIGDLLGLKALYYADWSALNSESKKLTQEEEKTAHEAPEGLTVQDTQEYRQLEKEYIEAAKERDIYKELFFEIFRSNRSSMMTGGNTIK